MPIAGNVYVTGQFQLPDNSVEIARWDGKRWYKLITGLPSVVRSLIIAPYLGVYNADNS